MKLSIGIRPQRSLIAKAGQALLRSAKAARKAAKQHGTPVYVWRDGKVVALKP